VSETDLVGGDKKCRHANYDWLSGLNLWASGKHGRIDGSYARAGMVRLPRDVPLTRPVRLLKAVDKVENPAAHFNKPKKVVQDKALSHDEKKKALNTWEQDE
jgi:hypothetical protein